MKPYENNLYRPILTKVWFHSCIKFWFVQNHALYFELLHRITSYESFFCHWATLDACLFLCAVHKDNLTMFLPILVGFESHSIQTAKLHSHCYKIYNKIIKCCWWTVLYCSNLIYCENLHSQTKQQGYAVFVRFL